MFNCTVTSPKTAGGSFMFQLAYLYTRGDPSQALLGNALSNSSSGGPECINWYTRLWTEILALRWWAQSATALGQRRSSTETIDQFRLLLICSQSWRSAVQSSLNVFLIDIARDSFMQLALLISLLLCIIDVKSSQYTVTVGCSPFNVAYCSTFKKNITFPYTLNSTRRWKSVRWEAFVKSVIDWSLWGDSDSNIEIRLTHAL